MLAFTWDFHTFHGPARIKRFLDNRLASTKPSAIALTEARLEQPFPDLAWILLLFDFEMDVGLANAVLRLIPQEGGGWKAFTLTTNLNVLKAFPENIGPRRDRYAQHGSWLAQREKECEFLECDPKVVIVGAGQSGLQLAARLETLGIPTLNVDKQPRIGDSWRDRYEALTVHSPVGLDHMAYLPFPPTWLEFAPAQKMANRLEFYADTLELNVWTSSIVLNTKQRKDNTWDVIVRRGDGTERKMHVQHVVLALGWGGTPRWSDIPGKEDFKGTVLHSSMYKNGKSLSGMKVVVMGTASSAHDIADECLEHKADVTMIQRDATYIMSAEKGIPAFLMSLYNETSTVPTDIADRLSNSMPFDVMKVFWRRITATLTTVSEMDKYDWLYLPVVLFETDCTAQKSILDGLNKAGFQTMGCPDDFGPFYLLLTRGGGFCIDVGTSQKIIDGKIKRNGKIERLTETGVKFQDGSVLPADAIIYATGYESLNTLIADICGEDTAARVGPIWNVDKEGESRNVWRYLGVPSLWYMIGGFGWSRFYSRHLALRASSANVS